MTFQRAMDIIFASVNLLCAIVYVDEIIILSRSPQQHLENTEEVLRLTKDMGMTIKLKKCDFFCQSINYLGYVIDLGKLMMARKNTETIAALRYSTTVSQIRSFLGHFNVYRRFMPWFAKIAAPFNQRIKNGKPFELDEKKREALRNLKSKLTFSGVPAMPKATGQFVVNPDASKAQLGFVFLQEQENKQLKSVSYWSSSLNSAVWTVLLLRSYMEGTHFFVRTDHFVVRMDHQTLRSILE